MDSIKYTNRYQMNSLATKSDRENFYPHTRINLEVINIRIDTKQKQFHKTYKTRVVTYLIPKTPLNYMSLWVCTHIKLSWCVTNKTFITFWKISLSPSTPSYIIITVTWKSNSENNTHIGDLNNQIHARHKMRPSCDVDSTKNFVFAWWFSGVFYYFVCYIL